MDPKVIKKSIADIFARCGSPSARLSIDYLVSQVLLHNDVSEVSFEKEYRSVQNYILASRKLAVYSGKRGGVELLPTGTMIYKGRR